MHQASKAWVRAETVNSEIDLNEVNKIWGPFLVCFFQELERLVHLTQSRINGCHHVRRDVGDSRLPLQLAEQLLGFSHPTCRCVYVPQSRHWIRVAL